MTSSRQSPNKSALRTGVDLVPLFETHPSAVKSLPTLYLSMWFPSKSSLLKSPSHQIRKFVEEGESPIRSPFIFNSPSEPENHISAPGLEGSISSATPRPTSLFMEPL